MIDIRDGVLVERPLHQNQFVSGGHVYRNGSFHVVHGLEKFMNHKENAFGAFQDIEGAFNITSFTAINTATRDLGLEETCCRWIGSILEGRLVRTFLMAAV